MRQAQQQNKKKNNKLVRFGAKRVGQIKIYRSIDSLNARQSENKRTQECAAIVGGFGKKATLLLCSPAAAALCALCLFVDLFVIIVACRF